ncbi:TDP-N-acetylfucosamine:lipid II N-acetylfucosaminyltransferase [Christiangramia sp. ASW11-125]|uniref:TDP-N-acetylfucosamine:lipid II N-acetylfucosaminyltransferase n=1 Tax=Christiangramia sp. ASW11-125 TaxID=3400701 RepID=UPI003AAA77D6
MKTEKLLHIVDDEKFIDLAIKQFEKVAPGANLFAVLVNSSSHELQYINQKGKVKLIWDLEKQLNLYNYDAIFIHYMTEEKCKIINAAPLNLPVIWLFWGQDAQKLFMDRSYKEKTRKLIKDLLGWNEYLYPYTNWIRRLFLPYKERGRAMKRINFCAPVISNELELMNDRLSLNLEFIDFSYGSLDDFVTEAIRDLEISGPNILVGNSSTAACNHIESFDFIKENLDWKHRKIIVPLSYGSKDYRNEILKIGQEYFGENFMPLTDFLPIQKYNEFLGSCSLAIMNHNRQQALGNIIGLLWLGTKIIMDKNNPLFQFLTSKGFIIQSVQALASDRIDSHSGSLGIKKRNHNRKLLQLYYSDEVVLEKTKKLVDAFVVCETAFSQ